MAGWPAGTRSMRVTSNCGRSTRDRNRPMRWRACRSCWERASFHRPAGKRPCDEAVRIQEYIRDQVYATRKKDYEDPFRQSTFRNAEEMRAVLGTPEANSFVRQIRQETADFQQLVAAVQARA